MTMSELDAAFRAAAYRVDLDGTQCVLRIGAPPPCALADWIARRTGATPAWLITACNPRGQRVSDAANRGRSLVLTQLIARSGLHNLAAVNRDPAGAWPDEPGWLIAGLEEGRARDLARRFDQAALVAVTPANCTLVWITGPGSDTVCRSAQRSE